MLMLNMYQIALYSGCCRNHFSFVQVLSRGSDHVLLVSLWRIGKHDGVCSDDVKRSRDVMIVTRAPSAFAKATPSSSANFDNSEPSVGTQNVPVHALCAKARSISFFRLPKRRGCWQMRIECAGQRLLPAVAQLSSNSSIAINCHARDWPHRSLPEQATRMEGLLEWVPAKSTPP